jgi:DNA-binding CsgD family transcriptional regulator/PAS domain-containing protein
VSSLDQLVYELHAAGSAEGIYTTFLRGVGSVMPGFGFGVYRFDAGTDVPSAVHARGVPDSFLARYEQEGRVHDPVLRRLKASRSTISSDLDLSARQWRGGPLFELVRSAGIARTIQAPLVIGGELTGTLNVAGSTRQGAFTGRDRERLALLGRHMALALARSEREGELGRRCAILEAGLDSMSVPLIVSDLEREILFVNRAAEALVAADGERVASAICLNTDELASDGADRRVATWATPALTVRSIRAAPTIVVSFAQRAPALAAAPLAILSPREREIVELVARGLSNDEIAALASISRNTVKHHLKRTFQKLRVRSRAELAARAAAAGDEGMPFRTEDAR